MKNDLNKKNGAPFAYSNEAINEFHSDLSSIRKKLEEGNNANFGDEIERKMLITIADEDILHDFLTSHRENKDFKTVIQKVRLIDYFYSTNLRMSGANAFAEVANIILKCSDFDERVERGCSDLVSEIANDIKKVTETNHFSFVTKYCCNHNFHVYGNDNYSIYDTAMNKAIPQYLNVTQSYIYNECRGAMDYERYHKIIGKMIDEYGITTKYKRRDTDFYLWYHYR
ncbi:MAG: hypothetical protein U0K87_02810 [Ruminococcus sp.]|jgi:hypothetical protein|nr:hypothetical protein [Ruminococcus sp.]